MPVLLELCGPLLELVSERSGHTGIAETSVGPFPCGMSFSGVLLLA